jgi:HEPN domain-containing protein
MIIDPDSELDKSHDTINIYYVLVKKYPPKRDLLTGIRYCRKYFTEARYPIDGTDIYTKEFAERFLYYVEEIKLYIDQECQSTLDDLKNMYDRERK